MGINANGITPKKRHRMQFRFWLDANKQSERQMIQDLEHFKSKRQFADTIRKALSLFFSLMLGDLSILRELFPATVEALRVDACATLLAENAKLKQQIIGLQNTIAKLDAMPTSDDTAIQKQLARLEQLLIDQGNVPVKSPIAPSGGVGLKSNSSGIVGLKGNGLGSNFTAPAPTFDDDDDLPELTISKTKSTVNANQNLIQAMLSLEGKAHHAND